MSKLDDIVMHLFSSKYVRYYSYQNGPFSVCRKLIDDALYFLTQDVTTKLSIPSIASSITNM